MITLMFDGDEEMQHAQIMDAPAVFAKQGMAWSIRAAMSFHNKKYGAPHVCMYCTAYVEQTMEAAFKCDNMELFDMHDRPISNPVKDDENLLIRSPIGTFVNLAALPEHVQGAVMQRYREQHKDCGHD